MAVENKSGKGRREINLSPLITRLEASEKIIIMKSASDIIFKSQIFGAMSKNYFYRKYI